MEEEHHIERRADTDPVANAQSCGFDVLPTAEFDVNEFITNYIEDNVGVSLKLNSCIINGIIVMANAEADIDQCEATMATAAP